MRRNNDLSLDGAIPAEIAENLNEYFPEFGDLNYEEVLQHQESVYQSLQGYNRNKDSSYYGNQFPGQQGNSSRSGSFASQLALDEALARSLQELEDDFDDLNLSSQSASSATANREVSFRETPVTPVNRNVTRDDVDPDNMSYEQLQSLGEAVGSVNKGLSKELISRLPYFKYKTGFFSKKKEKQECVICFTNYKNGDKLTALPCAHQYHSTCITPWLVGNKCCPICKEEVSAD